jgi:Flp pilus assembly protein TadG
MTRRSRTWPGCRGQAGSAAVELVLVTPVFVVLLLFVVGLGRMAHARQDVTTAAGVAARAASIEVNPAVAASDARRAANETLANKGLDCRALRVAVDVSDYRPGGIVKATVWCTADLSDAVLSGLPGSRTFTATGRVPIETWRQDQP